MPRMTAFALALALLASVIAGRGPAPAAAQEATPTAAPMPPHRVERLLRQYYAVFSTGDLATLPTVVSADLVDHNPGPGQLPGIEGLQQRISAWRAGFPNLRASIRDVIVEGDKAVVRLELIGHHRGEFMGVPATGRRVSFGAIDLWRVADGRLVELWHAERMPAVLSAIGAVPGAGADATPTAVPAATEPPSASPEAGADTAANREIARRFYEEVLGGRNPAATAELIAPDARFHLPEGDVTGAQGLLGALAPIVRGVSDLRITVEDTIAEGDRVAVRWTITATHSGEVLGAPPTGNTLTLRGISILRIATGRIVEEWVEQDQIDFLVQLGLLPAPAPLPTPTPTPTEEPVAEDAASPAPVEEATPAATPGS